jgi:hypothetical protein
MKRNVFNAAVLAVCWGWGMGTVPAPVRAQNATADAGTKPPTEAKRFVGFEHGMGIGGWLTNYKRFNVLPDKWKMTLSPGDYEHFETYITKDDVRNIASFGVDHIRLGFDQIVLEEKPYVFRERTFRCVDNFVAWCHESKLNVVLNLHKAIGNYCDVPSPVNLLDDAELQNRFIALWLEFERRYHTDTGVVFELLNEVKDVKPAAWNALVERTIREIRKVNPTRKIVVGSTCWNSCDKLKDLQLFDDENVIYTFHFYGPFEFTHQRGVLQSGPLYYNRAMPYPGDIERYRDYKRFVEGAKNPYSTCPRMDINILRQWLQPAFDFAKKHPDKILWCGEFGTIRHCDIASRENWMNDVILLLKEHGISYCVWNYLSTPNDGNRFSLVDDDKRQILSPRLLEIIQGAVKPLQAD